MRSLLEKELAVCVNWFPLPFIYGWQQEITQHPKIALIIKTQDDYQDAIEQTIRQHLGNTNLTEISLTNVDQDFLDWLIVQISPQFLSTT
ncbi:divalent cation tolerance protein [Chondrocystis sp. NIES-4102]|nr:divalent cation tolerance protein [Chondrocystis sp. NIES-4102]